MSPAAVLAIVAALAVGFALGAVTGNPRRRARVKRVSDGVAELARGNLAHRVILPGADEPALMAEHLNELADAVQAERDGVAARDEARRRLLANVSHDLRTPITSIAGYVDALQRGLGDDPERYLAVLAMKADELARLTDDLFYAARLDAGDLRLAVAPLDLAEEVRRAVLGFEPELAAKGVCVTVDLPELPCVVAADRSAVSRILANLVSNGLRHGNGMTAFDVSMADVGAAYEVRVRNDGPKLGEDADRLFRRGERGPTGGAGLGLSIARELAERMGATTSAESGPETGATFKLVFPKAAEEAASA